MRISVAAALAAFSFFLNIVVSHVRILHILLVIQLQLLKYRPSLVEYQTTTSRFVGDFCLLSR